MDYYQTLRLQTRYHICLLNQAGRPGSVLLACLPPESVTPQRENLKRKNAGQGNPTAAILPINIAFQIINRLNVLDIQMDQVYISKYKL